MTAIWKAGPSFFQGARHVLVLWLGHVLMFIRLSGVAGGRMSRGDEVRTPLRLERSNSGTSRIDTRIALDRDSSGGAWPPIAGRYAMGLGERRH